MNNQAILERNRRVGLTLTIFFILLFIFAVVLITNRSKAIEHHNRGVEFMNQGKLDEAIDAYKNAIRVLPDLPDAHRNLGHVYSKKGMWDEAIVAFKEALRVASKRHDSNWHWFAVVNDNLAVAYLQKGMPTEAIAASKEALRVKPDAHQHFKLGLSYLVAGRIDEGRTEMQTVVDRYPKSKEAQIATQMLGVVKNIKGSGGDWEIREN